MAPEPSILVSAGPCWRVSVTLGGGAGSFHRIPEFTREALMSLIQVKLIEGVFTKTQKSARNIPDLRPVLSAVSAAIQ